MTTNTAHANCSHPATKGARAACRGAARTKRVVDARAAAEAIASRGQMEKALEALELDAVVRLRRSFYAVIGTEAGHRYIVDTVSGNCSCGFGHRRLRAVAKARKNGERGAEVCYHVLAARIKAASYVGTEPVIVEPRVFAL